MHILNSMNVEKLLNVVVRAGKILIESGAEIYRVEETMIRLCKSYSEVQIADSFVTGTGIMLSITVDGKTSTRIGRVRSKSVDLNVIDMVNSLSRRVSYDPISVDELEKEIDRIEGKERYSFWITLLFAGVGAAGFAIFFDGNIVDSIAAFLIGIIIRCVTTFFEKYRVNSFFTNAIASAIAVCCSIGSVYLCYGIDYNVVIISSIMLLVPGLAITNAIRDTVAGDYLSGLSRGTEATLTALAIAIGAGFMLSILL